MTELLKETMEIIEQLKRTEKKFDEAVDALEAEIDARLKELKLKDHRMEV